MKSVKASVLVELENFKGLTVLIISGNSFKNEDIILISGRCKMLTYFDISRNTNLL